MHTHIFIKRTEDVLSFPHGTPEYDRQYKRVTHIIITYYIIIVQKTTMIDDIDSCLY